MANIAILIPILFLLTSAVYTQQQQQDDQVPYRLSSEVGETNQTCQQKCFGYQLCLAECERKAKQKYQIGLIIGLSVGIFLLLCIVVTLIFVACLCPCMFCPCHFYQEVKRSLNKVDSLKCTAEKWQREQKHLLQLLSLPNQQLQFTFKRNDEKYYSRITSNIFRKQQQICKSRIQFTGVDSIFGDWQANGYILMKKKGLKLWFCKNYKVNKKSNPKEQEQKKTETQSDKKVAIIQEFTSKQNGLVLKSDRIDLGRGIIIGTWSLYHNYYKGDHFQQTGTWEIKSMADMNKIIERAESGLPTSTSVMTSIIE